MTPVQEPMLDGHEVVTDGATIEARQGGLIVGAARLYADDAERRQLLLLLDPVSFLAGTAAELARRGVRLAREAGGATLRVTGPLGTSEVLDALRDELPGCTVRPAGSTWILVGSLLPA